MELLKPLKLTATLAKANKSTQVSSVERSQKTSTVKIRSKLRTSSGSRIGWRKPRKLKIFFSTQLQTRTATAARAIKSTSSQLTLQHRCRARSR